MGFGRRMSVGVVGPKHGDRWAAGRYGGWSGVGLEAGGKPIPGKVQGDQWRSVEESVCGEKRNQSRGQEFWQGSAGRKILYAARICTWQTKTAPTPSITPPPGGRDRDRGILEPRGILDPPTGHAWGGSYKVSCRKYKGQKNNFLALRRGVRYGEVIQWGGQRKRVDNPQ